MLTAAAGSWTGTQPISYGYQWRRCDSAGANCVDIAGATGQTYTLASADVGSTARVAERDEHRWFGFGRFGADGSRRRRARTAGEWFAAVDFGDGASGSGVDRGCGELDGYAADQLWLSVAPLR